jgi:hypothetical protein
MINRNFTFFKNVKKRYKEVNHSRSAFSDFHTTHSVDPYQQKNNMSFK